MKRNKEENILERSVHRLATHGMSNNRIYNIYMNMKSRCYAVNSTGYKNYGARGVKICDEWIDSEFGFINFNDWSMRHGYNDSLTIDRIDVDGHYAPINCRWATPKEQANNRRSNILIEINGITKNAAQWDEDVGLGNRTVYYRYTKLGIRGEELLLPVGKSEKQSGHKGITWCKDDGRWRVRIFVNGKRINVGRFKDLNEAIEQKKITEEKFITTVGDDAESV